MENLNVKLMLALVFGIICASISVPPVSAHTDGQCWYDISKCMMDQMGHIFHGPRLNPGSPLNLTEALCCPLVVQTAQNDRECFCAMDTLIHQDPSQAANIINLLSHCSIVDSVASLDNFCLDIAPSAAEAPIIPFVEGPLMSVMPPL